MSAKDIADSDIKQIGRLVKALSYTKDNEDAANQTELYTSLDEYFRKRFRKVDVKDAADILIAVGDDTEHQLSVLDDKFWFWETLEEAIRPNIDKLTDDQIISLMKAFAANFKGSDDLWDYFYIRVFRSTSSPY